MWGSPSGAKLLSWLSCPRRGGTRFVPRALAWLYLCHCCPGPFWHRCLSSPTGCNPLSASSRCHGAAGRPAPACRQLPVPSPRLLLGELDAKAPFPPCAPHAVPSRSLRRSCRCRGRGSVLWPIPGCLRRLPQLRVCFLLRSCSQQQRVVCELSLLGLAVK